MWELLTPRERDVGELLCRGYRNEQIGKELGITLRTVKDNIRHMALRLGFSNRRFKRIRMAVALTYERSPHLIPFAGGDRAQFLGRMSAQDFCNWIATDRGWCAEVRNRYAESTRAKLDWSPDDYLRIKSSHTQAPTSLHESGHNDALR